MKEQRRDVRVDEEDRVVIELKRQQGGEAIETFDALTRDLSLGGVRVQADRPFDEGVDLTLTIALAKSRKFIRILGRVRWVREVEPGLFEAGIEFQHQIPGSVMSLINHLFQKKGRPHHCLPLTGGGPGAAEDKTGEER
jgi:c-di-GMP-binding flagellar brake protein YcgR